MTLVWCWRRAVQTWKWAWWSISGAWPTCCDQCLRRCWRGSSLRLCGRTGAVGCQCSKCFIRCVSVAQGPSRGGSAGLAQGEGRQKVTSLRSVARGAGGFEGGHLTTQPASRLPWWSALPCPAHVSGQGPKRAELEVEKSGHVQAVTTAVAKSRLVTGKLGQPGP